MQRYVLDDFMFFYFSEKLTQIFLDAVFSLSLVNYAKKSIICHSPEGSHIQRAKHLFFLLKRKLIGRLYKVTYGRSGFTTLINRINSLTAILPLRDD